MAQTTTLPFFFSQAVNYQPGNSQPSSVFVADINGDGYPDVVAANQSGANGHGSVSVFFGNGDGTLRAPVNYDSGGANAVSVYVADVNADGRLDIVVANQGTSPADGSVSVLLGNGDGTFQPAVTYGSGGPGATSVFVVDVNGDGKPDIVVANQGVTAADGSVSVLLNGAGGVSGAFGAAVTYDSGGVDATAITLADVNGDGYPDILVANNCYPLSACPQQQGGVAVLLNDKTGNFGPAVSYPTPGPATSIAFGDVNGDGIPDLFVGASTYGAGFLVGDGTGNYGAYEAISGMQGQVVSVAVRDINGDGINDLLIGLGYCASCDLSLGSGVTVLQGTGGGNYGPPIIYTVGGDLAGAIALGDLNGDNKPDLVVANQCDDGIIDTACGGSVAVLLNSVNGLTTTLTISHDPVLTGQSVTYTATVIPGPGAPSPIGTVTFRDTSTVIASGVPLTFDAGLYQAVYSTSYAASGVHEISATYSLIQVTPNPTISQISSPLAETINLGSTPPVITSPVSGYTSSNTAVSISGSGATPNGAVSVLDGSAALLTTTADANGNFGGTVVLVAGPHSLTATDLATGLTSAAVTITITRPPIVITSPVSGYASLNSAVPIGVTGATASGSVKIQDGNLVLATGVADANGNFAITVVLGVGVHSLTATDQASGMISAAVTITITPPTVVITSPASGYTSPNPSVSITGAGATPHGSVAILDGSTALLTATADLNGNFGGTVVLAVGPHSLTAIDQATGSASAAVAMTIIPALVSINVAETITVTDTEFVPPPITMTGIVAPVAYYSAGSEGFVGIAPGQTTTQPLTLANIGLQPLVISADGITQDASNSFSVTAVQCTTGTNSIPVTLAPGGECVLTISYTAPASGTPSGTITFTDNAPLSNLTSTASGADFEQSLTLSTTAATTAAPPAPPTTVSISVNEPIVVSDQISVVTLKTITVTPASPTIAESATEPFVATGTFSDGSTQNLTAAVTWSSSTPTVATMSGSVAAGIAYGRSTITAKLGSVSASTTLTVLSYLTITAKVASISLDIKGEYVVKISVANNGNSTASRVAPITGLLGTKTPTSSVSATNVAPGATGTVTLVFPASAGKQLSKQSLIVLGTATGTNPNGSAVLPGIWAVSTTVTLP